MARILVADDDVDIRDLIDFKLSSLGHDVVAVGDGDLALQQVRSQAFDLAVLDVSMPVLSGLDALRAIRADPEHARLPVLLLTGHSDEARRQAGLEAGADDYLTKPFSPRHLGDVVETMLGPSD